MAAAEDGKQSPPASKEESGGRGWGGWGFSLSVLSDIQKAASTAVEEISKNAVAVAKSAAKGIAEIQTAAASDLDSANEEGDSTPEISPSQAEDTPESNDNPLRMSALDKLEKASEDSLFGQGLKVIDNSVEGFASGAWQAIGSAWKGGSTLVHKLEHSAANLADSIQHGALPVQANSLAPSILETGKSFTVKGMQVLERVGKETMELFIAETGFEAEKNPDQVDHQVDEEVTFDRCFYIYGGPDQLEELEALSNHYALLFNRRKAKLLSERKSFYDGKLRQVQQFFRLETDIEEIGADLDKGKNIKALDDSSGTEMKILCDSSLSKAADMAEGFTAVLGALAANEIITRTTERLETIHSEGVHRLSELCCCAVSQLLMLGKSVISNANKSKTEMVADSIVNPIWPEDSESKAKIIRSKAKSMSGDVETVYNSFVTAVSDIFGAYEAAIGSASPDTDGLGEQKSIQDKAKSISSNLGADRTTAIGEIQVAVQYLAYVVLSTSMPTAA